MTQSDITLFIVGFVIIGYALGAVLAFGVCITQYVLKGRRGGAYARVGDTPNYQS